MGRSRSHLLGALLLVGVASACASIMGIEEPLQREATLPDASISGSETEGGAANCEGASCPCTADPDCRFPFAKCVAQRCVECTTAPDSCDEGRHCLPTNECAAGCKTNDECGRVTNGVLPICNLERHQCVECTPQSGCIAPQVCSPGGTCTDACTGTGQSTCPAGEECCGDLCIDTKKDIFNCNACGITCGALNGAPSCSNGSCSWTCNPGYTHCATDTAGCETRTATDATKCGSCTNNCNTTVQNASGISCVTSACTYAACAPGFADCDGNRANGCECACPAECNGGCAGGTCLINVTTNGATTLTCPPGRPCKVVCDAAVTQCTASIICASQFPCTVLCKGKDACNGASVNGSSNANICLDCQGNPGCNSVNMNKNGGTCSKVCNTCNSCSGNCNSCVDVASCP